MKSKDLEPSCKTAMCHYAGLRAGQEEHRAHGTSDTLGTLLSRYMSVWANPSPFDGSDPAPDVDAVALVGDSLPGKRTRIRYHSFISPSGAGPWNHVRRAAAWPFMARLNYVKQLSTTNIGLNIEATHNRLAHSLGTMDVCAALLQEACQSAKGGCQPDVYEATAVVLFALLHDAYHGPFGHSLDRIGDVILPDEGDVRIDKALLMRDIERAEHENGSLWRMLLKLSEWTLASGTDQWRLKLRKSTVSKTADAFAKQLLKNLRAFTVPEQLAVDLPAVYWLRDLVDSELDADRLDYLMRDTHALWWQPTLQAGPIQRLVNGVQVLPGTVTLPVYTEQGAKPQAFPVHRLHWDESHKRLVEEILELRASLYAKVYEAPEKRAYDEMIAHSLVWMIRRELDPEGWSPKVEVEADFLERICRTTDDELFHLMYELGASEKHNVAVAVLHDVAVGRPFVEVWRRAIPVGDLGAAQDRMQSISELWAQAEDVLNAEYVATRRRPLRHNEAPNVGEMLRRFRKCVEKDDINALLFLLETNLGRSYKSRQLVEEMLWDRFLDGGGSVEHRQAVAQVLAQVHEQMKWSCRQDTTDTADMIAEFRHTPLLFVSVPWVPMVTEDVDLAYWEVQTGILFHRDGVASQEPKDIARRKRQEMYPLSVYVPQAIGQHGELVSLVRRLIDEMIWSLSWQMPQDVLAAKVEWWHGVQVPDN